MSNKWNFSKEDSRFLLTYLLSLLLIGVGYLSILPVFEGFDETAHFSSLRQVYSTKTIPLYGSSYLAKDVVEHKGPLAYTSGEPPFDKGVTYSEFFQTSDLKNHYQSEYLDKAYELSFSPSNELNWQAQHPPLYYLLVAPVFKMIDSLNLVSQFFVLRMVSYLLALLGIAFGFLAVCKLNDSQLKNRAVVGFLLYPIIFPMFFPEFARIGNDSLCLFIVGLMSYLLSMWFKNESNKRLPIAIGFSLGLGLLTKALFVPIAIGLLAFLLIEIFIDKPNAALLKQKIWSLTKIFAVAMIVGGWWYIYKLWVFGELSGSNEAIILANQGGLISGLKENLSFNNLFIGGITPVVTYIWAGTWSLVRLPILLYIPLVLLTLWVSISYITHLKNQKITRSDRLLASMLLFFVGGIFWHIFVSIAINGNGATPGWYLHILMVFIVPAIGIGAIRIIEQRRFILFFILLIYAATFQLLALWAQFTLFTGCSTKGDNKYYKFPEGSYCFDQINVLFDRISTLGFPYLSISFIVGFSSLIWLVVKTLKKQQYYSTSNITNKGT